MLHHAAVLHVSARSHLVPLKAQFLLVVFHFQVHWPGTQLVQALTRVHHVFDFVDHTVLDSCILGFPLVVLLVLHIGKVLHVGLQLLEKNETESYQSLSVYLLQIFSFLHSSDVQEYVVLFLQNCWITFNEGLDELGE